MGGGEKKNENLSLIVANIGLSNPIGPDLAMSDSNSIVLYICLGQACHLI